jgi:hypothetical protein
MAQRKIPKCKARLAVKPIGENPRAKESLIEFFEKEIWPKVPAEVLGKPPSKREREEILGYGG